MRAPYFVALGGSLLVLIAGALVVLSTRLYPTRAPDRLESFSHEGGDPRLGAREQRVGPV